MRIVLPVSHSACVLRIPGIPPRPDRIVDANAAAAAAAAEATLQADCRRVPIQNYRARAIGPATPPPPPP
ncbi:hypothetical protein CHU98_g4847 [Xylaria longipes]|nr:hypothetical protein CHU98_g4847 [Xylaria longipes]